MMNRPYIFCHMLTSLDGKIMGSYMETPEGTVAGEVFDSITFGENPYYHHQGWMCGRITTDDNFTFYREPELDENAPAVPEGDFIQKSDVPMYYFSLDPSGRLGWQENTVSYAGATARVVEILTEKASNAYRAFLRKRSIPYIIAGEREVDYGLAMEKVRELFGVETLMLGGGGVINWSFIQAGMCDELSIVIAAAADGSSETPALFETRGGWASDQARGFILENAEVRDGGCIWLRYKVENKG